MAKALRSRKRHPKTEEAAAPLPTAAPSGSSPAEMPDLREGHKAVGYRGTWEALADTHQDPEDPSKIRLFYAQRSQPKDIRVNQDSRNGWNREHLWPQSRGAKREPMRSDLHHLMPADATVNSSRGSLDFTNTKGRPIDDAPGASVSADGFNPPDEIKGDIARALMYMETRYSGEGNEPDLHLEPGRPSKKKNTMGNLCTLLAWHHQDPPDDRERARNDAVERWQGNRNPYIDHPELADERYGGQCPLQAHLQSADASQEGWTAKLRAAAAEPKGPRPESNDATPAPRRRPHSHPELRPV